MIRSRSSADPWVKTGCWKTSLRPSTSRHGSGGVFSATCMSCFAHFKASVATALHEKVWPLFESRKIVPVIDSTFPLARAAEAHARMEASTHVGKIVLTVE